MVSANTKDVIAQDSLCLQIKAWGGRMSSLMKPVKLEAVELVRGWLILFVFVIGVWAIFIYGLHAIWALIG